MSAASPVSPIAPVTSISAAPAGARSRSAGAPLGERRRPARPRLRSTGRAIGLPAWNWRVAARCRTENSEDLFVTGAQQRDVRDFCFSCPVRTECLAHALDQQVEFGVWGGMTERERRALLRRRPDVRSWARLLGRARTAHYAGAGSRSA